MFNVKKLRLAKEISAFVAILSFILLPLVGGNVPAQENNASALFGPGLLDTPGFFDKDFKPVLGGNVGTSAPGNRTIVLPDGKILVAGNFQLANGVSKNGIARFNPDGTLDASFNTKSGAAGGAINAMGVQSNG